MPIISLSLYNGQRRTKSMCSFQIKHYAFAPNLLLNGNLVTILLLQTYT